MNRSRRKSLNSLNAASLARWIVLTMFIALTGLVYVYLNIQLHRLGDQQNRLEKELAGLRNQNEDASAQIAALTSRAALQRRLKEGYLKMVPIAEQSIVRLNATGEKQIGVRGSDDSDQRVAKNDIRP
jgi:cell division protein FtsB